MMSEPKTQQEPSMEEILASIRRIISEDGAGEPKAAAAVEAVPDPEPEPEPEPQEVETNEVLELTEVVEETPEPIEEPPSEEEEIELREEEPEPLIPAVPPPPAPEPEPPAMAAAPAQADGGLVSPPTAASATNMLSSLVEAVDASRGGTPIGHGNRTIEDLVKEVMRPMIKDWLDANLPGLVERLVRREIERLARDAEGGD